MTKEKKKKDVTCNVEQNTFELRARKSQRERTINEEMKRLVKSPTELFN